MLTKHFLAFQALVLLSIITIAEIPTGYYNSAQGKTGAALKTALSQIIDSHNTLGYSTLWTAFEDTDKKSNGKVWDMYSDVPGGTPPYEYTFGNNQCGNYAAEGDCYNREHSFPKSWFYDASPMYSDLFHIVPSDGYVNGKRSNHPFGEVGNATWTSQNGSKVGTSSYPGYSGTVFEPIDEYKGDFARGYFYMATRYESNIANWNSVMLDGTAFPAFDDWALNLLMEWHEQDPVSAKEIARNNAIYQWQLNRNPFIDHPEFVNLIWGNGELPLAITSTPVVHVFANHPYNYTITTEGGNGSSINISCPEKPSWLTLTAEGNGTASLHGTPSIQDEGIHPIIIVASNGESQVEQNYYLTVEVIIAELVFTSTPVTSAIVNQTYSYLLTAEGDPLEDITFEALILPDWLNLSDQGNGSAVLYGTPEESHIGTNQVEISAQAGSLTAKQVFSIMVSEGGQGSSFAETFTMMPDASSAYIDRSWTGDHGVYWTATQARTDQEIDGRAICLKDVGQPFLLSETLAGGISAISFEHQQKFTGAGGTISLFINDQPIGDPVEVSSTIAKASFEGLNFTGEVIIKLVSNGLSRIAIDNVSWIQFQPTIQYQLIVQAEGSGVLTPAPGTYTFDANSQVQIQATAAQDWTFEKWTINGTEITVAETLVQLTEDITATAWFTFNTNITEDENLAYQAFPNPFGDYLSISSPEDISLMVIYNLTGQEVMKIDNPQMPIRTHSLETGFYILKLEMKNGYSLQQKVLKQ